jgi:ATP-dependent Lon protease
VYAKMGLEDMLHFSDEVLKFIIEEYTSESGVRKLKEILFEIVGEVNLDVLKNVNCYLELPINITIQDIKTKFLKDKDDIRYKKIHNESKIGVINGLWANALGKGGVIPIQVNWRPSEKFLHLHLTGMQGDVMKESMSVALTLAWNLTNNDKRNDIINKYGDSLNGLHIHCPEGAVPKDGPSAGTAITSVIYSLLNDKKIKYNIAITGEISLDGCVSEIGGLDLKILGAIKAGVKEILFPVDNMKDYDNFMKKYKDKILIEDIKFHPVNKIEEVFELIFE